MSRQTAWVLALVLTCTPVLGASAPRSASPVNSDQTQAKPPTKDGNDRAQPVSGAPTDRNRWKWWLYDRAELAISDQQSQAISQIFEATIPKLRETRQELDRAEDELSRTIKEHKADLATISLLIDRVENARAQYTKMRVLMLYRMHLLMSAEQRGKLEALRARQDRERRDRDKNPSADHRRKP